jgi:hypothetical protein
LQLDGSYFVGERDGTTPAAVHDGLQVRRARVELSGGLGPWFTFQSGLELANPARPTPTDVFANVRGLRRGHQAGGHRVLNGTDGARRHPTQHPTIGPSTMARSMSIRSPGWVH